MKPSQQAAIDTLKDQIRRMINTSMKEEYFPAITRFDVDEAEWGVMVFAETELTGLSEDNLLRALEHTFWSAAIGPKGKITLHSGPDSLKQFNGGTYFGMHIKYL